MNRINEKTNSNLGKGKLEFPHVIVILVFMTLLATILTHVIPAGQYDMVLNEVTGRRVIDTNSFKYIESSPVGLFEMLISIEEGLISAANISFMVIAISSAFHIVKKTGTVSAGILLLKRSIEKNSKKAGLAIVLVAILFAVGGSTGFLDPATTLPFVTIFVTLAISLGYDAIVGLAITIMPVCIGFAASTIGVFNVGIAQGIAELPKFSGLGFRVVVLLVTTAIWIIYTLRYANIIKKDPSKSYVYGMDVSQFTNSKDDVEVSLTPKHVASLAVFIVGFIIMAYGLIKLGWGFNEIAGLFFAVSIVVGIINRWSPNKLAKTFVEGASMVTIAIIVIGLARGVIIVMTKGHIVDTIIHSFSMQLSGIGIYASSVGMLIFQTLLNFFIPSGSGQALVSMPIIVPLADLVGINRQIAVLIFQFGDGLSNLLWPNGLFLVACAFAKVPLNKYYKWFLPIFAIMFIVQVMFVFIAINMNYGPF